MLNPNRTLVHLTKEMKTALESLLSRCERHAQARLTSYAQSLPNFGTINPAAETDKWFRDVSNNSQVAVSEMLTTVEL